jgi:hypothetical protein
VVCGSVLVADNRGDLWRLRIQEDLFCGLYSIPALRVTIIGEKYKEEQKGPRMEHQGHGEERKNIQRMGLIYFHLLWLVTFHPGRTLLPSRNITTKI